MADPLSIASGIAALLDLCSNILKLLSTAKAAQNDLRIIDIEIKAFSTVLEELRDPTANQAGVNAAIEGCKETLDELTSGLEGLSISESCSSAPGKRRKIRDAVMWTLRKDDIEKLRAAIQQHKTNLMIGLLGDIGRDIKDIKSTVTAVHNSLSDQERSKVVSWIQQETNPTVNHNAACGLRKKEDNTGEWILRMSEWDSWLDSNTMPPSRLLWIHGIPGAGKTIFASFLIDQCEKHVRDMPPRAAQCVYYYCSYRHNRDESKAFLRWAVSQICRNLKHIPSQILDLYKMDHHPSVEELVGGLVELLTFVDVLYLMVDGVDEIKEPRDQLLDILVWMAISPQFAKVRLLATSRLYADIKTRLGPCSMTVPMSNEEVDKDIRKFVTREIKRTWTEPCRLSLREHVVEKLVDGAKGMFQWASCQVRILNRKLDASAVEQALQELPKDLDETYARILGENPKDYRDIASNVFVWLYGYSQTDNGLFIPDLPTSLLVHAVNFQRFPLSQYGACPSSIELSKIEEICGCLITVYSTDQTSDRFCDAVTFSHYTVLEFLLSDRARVHEEPVSFFHLTPWESNISYLRQALTLGTNLEANYSALPAGHFTVTTLTKQMAKMGTKLHTCPDGLDLMALAEIGFGALECWHIYLVSDDLWEILLGALNPRFLRQICRLNNDLYVVEWNGDPDTEDAVRLCDLIILQCGRGELVRRFIREKGGQGIFESNIRSYGLCVEHVTPQNDLYPRYMESPLSIIGIVSYQSACLSGIYQCWRHFTLSNLGLLELEYVDQSLLLYWVIPLHFRNKTCLCEPTECMLLHLLTRFIIR
ncbi:hypothetical protein V8F06_014214 [Rhypophila decipiens]